jgi:SAM-dependent methyltransferase
LSRTVYSLPDFGDMIADTGRTAAYARALTLRVDPSSVVLDIGTGAGILALLACRAGARKVYAVEPSDAIQVAREAAIANGFGDRVQFIQAMTTAIELPEAVDGIVSDLHGTTPMFGQSLVSILDARARLLKPGGWMIPARETMWVALVSSPEAYERAIGVWATEYGFDLTAARDRASNSWHKRWMSEEELIGTPQSWATLDYAQLQGPRASGEASWRIDEGCVAHGLAVWFDCEPTAGVTFSNSPKSGERHVYGQSFLPWRAAVSLSEGDLVSVQLRADFVGDEFVWGWNTRVDRRSSTETHTDRQSSWLSTMISSERLRRRAATFVPSLSEEARIDRCVLDLMAQRLAVGAIAEKVFATFPTAFADLDAALARVGSLSERYSK